MRVLRVFAPAASLIAMLCIAGEATADKFQNLFGHETGYCLVRGMRALPDGGAVITGNTEGAGDPDRSGFFLARTDRAGRVVWYRTFNGPRSDEAGGVELAPDGGFVVTGWTQSFNEDFANQIFLLKTDSLGVEEWMRLYTDPVGNSCAAHAIARFDGGYGIAGEGALGDAILLVVGADGRAAASMRYGGEQVDAATSIAALRGGGFVIAGVTNSFHLDSLGHAIDDLYLLRLDPAGMKIWSTSIASMNAGYGVAETGGGFLVAGTVRGRGIARGTSAAILKIDSNGEPVWMRAMYAGIGSEVGNDVIAAPGGEITVGGKTGGDGFGLFAWRLDATGATSWIRTFGVGFGNEDTRTKIAAGSSGLILAGEGDALPGSGGATAYLINTDGDGLTLCASTVARVDTAIVPIPVVVHDPGTGLALRDSIVSFPHETPTFGEQRVCGSTTVSEMAAPSRRLAIYPNPGRTRTTVAGIAGEGEWVDLYSILGARVRRAAAVAGSAVIDLRGLPAGIYAVRTRSARNVRPGTIIVR